MNAREHDLLLALRTARTAIDGAAKGLARLTRAISNMSPLPEQRDAGEVTARNLERQYAGLLESIDAVIEEG